jgi:hypothetical protein
MAKITTVHAGFLHDLGDLYDAQLQVTQTRPELLEMEERFAQPLEQIDQQLGHELVSRGAGPVGHPVAGR